jgi:hypothetical protein
MRITPAAALFRSLVRHHQVPRADLQVSPMQTSLDQLDGNLTKKKLSIPDVGIVSHPPRISLYIITFHVSTGRSASLKLQSNFSTATGSSVGSWYGETYSCASDCVASIRFRGSKTSIFSRRSIAVFCLFMRDRGPEEKIARLTIGIVGAQLLTERYSFSFRKTLYKA